MVNDASTVADDGLSVISSSGLSSAVQDDERSYPLVSLVVDPQQESSHNYEGRIPLAVQITMSGSTEKGECLWSRAAIESYGHALPTSRDLSFRKNS